jgi:hypothetical protein
MAAIRFTIRNALLLTAVAAVWAAVYSMVRRAGGWGESPFLVRFAMPCGTCAILLAMLGERRWVIVSCSALVGVACAAALGI